jgi:hypothetical protein
MNREIEGDKKEIEGDRGQMFKLLELSSFIFLATVGSDISL